MLSSNPMLKPAFKIQISHVVRGSNPMMNGNADFTGCRENELNINLGNHTGNAESARKRIQSFCSENEVTYEGIGLGYATLCVNGRKIDITPYHIDIDMMLEMINVSPKQNTPPSQLNAFELQKKLTKNEDIKELLQKVIPGPWKYSSKVDSFWLRFTEENDSKIKEQLEFLAAQNVTHKISKVENSTDYCVQIKKEALENFSIVLSTTTKAPLAPYK